MSLGGGESLARWVLSGGSEVCTPGSHGSLTTVREPARNFVSRWNCNDNACSAFSPCIECGHLRSVALSADHTRRTVLAIVVTAGFAVFAILLTWPLALHLRTHLPGDPSGDTGVYVWNLWVFSHELLGHGHFPISTDHVFPLTGGADFSLHNFTPLADVLAMLFIPPMGAVGSYNIVVLAALTTNGLAVYALCRSLGVRRWLAWTGGATFMGMPLISAREVAHLSLVCAAALPIFLMALNRALTKPNLANGVLVGSVVAAASYSDAYYAVYCLLMGGFVALWSVTTWRTGRAALNQTTRIALNIIIVVSAVVWVGTLAASSFRIALPVFSRQPGATYAPALVLVAVVLTRSWLTWRPHIQLSVPVLQLQQQLRAGAAAVLTCLVLISPELWGLAARAVSARLPTTATLWRSSPRGVDALAYLVPNPVHAAFGHWTERWLLPPVPDAFPELVASCSLVVVLVVILGFKRERLPGLWVSFTAFFAALALGPFIYVGGINTAIIGPWALLRYVPIVSMARSPSRFAIVAALGLTILFALTLEQWHTKARDRWSQRHARPLTAAVLFLIAVEIVPGTRKLYPAAVPEIYKVIRETDDSPGRLLELPTGIRDGTSSIGDFGATTVFFQTSHGMPVIGGYLSRVSDWRKRESRRIPVMEALFELSEGRPLTPLQEAAARASSRAFLARSCVQYVVIDKRRATPELRNFASDILRLSLIQEDAERILMTPSDRPDCEAPSRRRRGLQKARLAVRPDAVNNGAVP